MPATGRILITGANGNLGRRLIGHLSDRAVAPPIRAVVRSDRAAAALADRSSVPGFEIAVLDYADAAALARAASGCVAAVNLVGIIKEGSRSRYRDAHEAACEALAGAAASAGVERIVHLGIVGSRTDSPNACLASRARAEEILRAGPVPALVIRVPMVLGPDDYASRALRARARARVVPLLRGGAGLEQPIDADDVVTALTRALELPDPRDTVLDLAGPECLRGRELLLRCAALYGKRPLVVPIPLWAELAFAWLLEKLLPDPPLTRAMVGVLDHDDDVDTRTACDVLRLQLTPLDRTLRRCVGPDGSNP